MKRNRIAFRRCGLAWWYQVTHPWEVLGHYKDESRHFIQRGLYGYSDSDWWGLDWYLSEWLPHALRRFKTGAGYPGYDEASTYKKWGIIVEKMAKGFEASAKIKDEFPQGKTLAKLQAQEKEGLDLFVKWFGHLWD